MNCMKHSNLLHSKRLEKSILFSLFKLFFQCKHPFIDKPMVISKPAVPGTGLLGLSCTKILLHLICRIFFRSGVPKWSKQKKSSARRVNVCNVLLKVQDWYSTDVVCYTTISKNIVGRKAKGLQPRSQGNVGSFTKLISLLGAYQ